jgi:RNA polymerase sigma factor (sigma-70 family)
MYQNGKNIVFTDRSTDSVNAFLKEISHTHPLMPEEERSLWQRMRQGSAEARKQLIEANLRYVVSKAKDYTLSGAPLNDLIMAGCEGMVKAADHFDASLGNKFISYATWYVESEIRKLAYDFIRHGSVSLDEAVYDDAPTTLGDLLPAADSIAPDHSLRYDDMLLFVADCLDKIQFGFGNLLIDLHDMLQKGYTTGDFAEKHHLSDRQMARFMATASKYATRSLTPAA